LQRWKFKEVRLVRVVDWESTRRSSDASDATQEEEEERRGRRWSHRAARRPGG
jgi:hypothetical protein